MSKTTNDLESFRYMIRLFISTESQAVIDNTDSNHARVILEEMFAAAKRTAFVFCGCLSPQVWGGQNLANNIENAFERNVDVKFFIQNPNKIPLESPLIQVLRNHTEIASKDENKRTATRDIVFGSPSFVSLDHHFAVFDHKMYRFETDNERFQAKVCANAPEESAALERLIEAMLHRADSLPLPEVKTDFHA